MTRLPYEFSITIPRHLIGTPNGVMPMLNRICAVAGGQTSGSATGRWLGDDGVPVEELVRQITWYCASPEGAAVISRLLHKLAHLLIELGEQCVLVNVMGNRYLLDADDFTEKEDEPWYSTIRKFFAQL